MLLTITYTNGNKLTLSVNYAVAQDGELTYKVRKNPTDIAAPTRVPLANIRSFAVDPTDNSYNAYKLEKAPATEEDAVRANLEDAALALNTVREKMLDAMLASQQSESGEWITSADFAELNAAERKLKDLNSKYAPAYKRMSAKDLF